MHYYRGNIYPDEEQPNTIFVFGSNPEGRHGAGSAKIAMNYWGAVYGKGEGLQGRSYALPTTELRPECAATGLPHGQTMRPEQIIANIQKLYACAREHPELNFKVAYRHKHTRTLCGYSGYELMDMFVKAGPIPDNMYFSMEWWSTNYLWIGYPLDNPTSA